MVLMEGLTASGKKKTLTLDDSGNLISQGASEQIASGGLQEGTDITGVTMPAGGQSARGWLSAIWKLINDRFPTPVNSKMPVDGNWLQEGTDITGASMPSGGTSGRGWLSAIWKLISDRFPTLGTKSASGSIPVTLSTDGAFSTNFGLIGDGVASSELAQSSFISLFRYLLIATLAKGQQLMSGSISITIASNQSAVAAIASQSDAQGIRDRLMPSSGTSYTQVLGTANAGFLKGAAGTIYAMSVINTGPIKKYLLLFEKATAPNSSDTIFRVYPVPAADISQDGFLFIGQQEIGGGGISLNAGLAWMISISPTTPTAATASETILGFRWA
ncbi:hypothetical protein VF14_03610 [Nostoc linckia z18]|uniref:Uncharacterized protein n=2 Tax=Nostoc linckia TaxID=92942 RepID=A0A9Q5ZGI9_NOSLI|nr:hypothetical protein [Nostoc linckia]PHK41461.1 hypothetical protein VF12_06595 [Nostoc linckia z15]PHK46962.1 hypothetical protein VF13_08255 [Nostoc linckia z16]PHJ69223.1 hypothetical protein VF02_01080 [Nostoc linckia z1]PHJ73375.1 hypothetical protein VF05_02100 [Nostoc linckia z3]PHJ78722.1 hypothetical protein VF03_01085 [Nostoc linckia z2]